MKTATIPPIRDQSEFVRRGLAAIARSEADGDWIPAETVIAKLEAKVAAARERKKKSSSPHLEMIDRAWAQPTEGRATLPASGPSSCIPNPHRKDTLFLSPAMLSQTRKRLATRMTDPVLDRLQVAADLVGATLNQFVVQAALEKADMVLQGESTIVLTHRELLRLLAIIENPPPRNEKFLQAQARYLRAKDGKN